MNRLALLATVASFALTGAAFAQTGNSTTTPTTPPKPAATATAPAKAAAQPAKKTATAPTKPAAPKAAMAKKDMKPVKAAHHERAKKPAAMRPTMAADRLADRETKALNVLEAKGYGGSYQNFQRDGKNYSAMVMKNGKPEKVIVNPDAGTVTP